MREIDRLTIAGGVAGDVLMERAGGGACEVLRERFPRELRRGVVLLAGKGNNGGDALVMARHLRGRRVPAEVFLAARRTDLAGDAARNLKRFERAGGRVQSLGEKGLLEFSASAARAGVVVDGLFGTGLRGALDERSSALVEAVNAAPCPILAVDVPSGLDGDRGVPLGAAVQATVTATFAFPKTGLLVHPGADFAGEVVVVDIGVSPEAVRAVAPRQRLLTGVSVAAALPPRPRDSHKGTYGHVLVLAGSVGKSGAAALCGRAALRAGAGLTTIASPAPALGHATLATPELMTAPVPDHDGAFAFSIADSTRFLHLLDGKSAVVFGPGVGTTPAVRVLMEWLIGSSPLPLVIDADGLNCLAGQIGWLRKKRCPIVLTPHPGEMARLVSATSEVVQGDRLGAARRLASDYGVTVVLKGARTVIAAPDGVVAINPTGNPGMASGGMGDALAGMIGSLLAQGVPEDEAAAAAVFWHGYAADRVARRQGEAGLLASDVIEELPRALADLQEAAFAVR